MPHNLHYKGAGGVDPERNRANTGPSRSAQHERIQERILRSTQRRAARAEVNRYLEGQENRAGQGRRAEKVSKEAIARRLRMRGPK